MKVRYSKPKHQRILKSISHNYNKQIPRKTRRPIWIEPIGDNWWFNLNSGQWEQDPESLSHKSSSYYSMHYHGFNNVYSLKAAKRKITNWDVPKGTEFKVDLPFKGHSFTVTK